MYAQHTQHEYNDRGYRKQGKRLHHRELSITVALLCAVLLLYIPRKGMTPTAAAAAACGSISSIRLLLCSPLLYIRCERSDCSPTLIRPSLLYNRAEPTQSALPPLPPLLLLFFFPHSALVPPPERIRSIAAASAWRKNDI